MPKAVLSDFSGTGHAQNVKDIFRNDAPNDWSIEITQAGSFSSSTSLTAAVNYAVETGAKIILRPLSDQNYEKQAISRWFFENYGGIIVHAQESNSNIQVNRPEYILAGQMVVGAEDPSDGGLEDDTSYGPGLEIDAEPSNQGAAQSWAVPTIGALMARLYNEHGNFYDARSVIRDLALANNPENQWSPERGYGFVYGYNHPDSNYDQRPSNSSPQPPLEPRGNDMGSLSAEVRFAPFKTSDFDHTEVQIDGNTFRTSENYISFDPGQQGTWTATLRTVHGDGTKSEPVTTTVEIGEPGPNVETFTPNFSSREFDFEHTYGGSTWDFQAEAYYEMSPNDNVVEFGFINTGSEEAKISLPGSPDGGSVDEVSFPQPEITLQPEESKKVEGTHQNLQSSTPPPTDGHLSTGFSVYFDPRQYQYVVPAGNTDLLVRGFYFENSIPSWSSTTLSSDWDQFELAANDSFVVLDDETLNVSASGGVLKNDSGTNASVSLVSGPSNAANFNLNSDGSFTYEPTSVGEDSFQYRITADEGTTTATATITVKSPQESFANKIGGIADVDDGHGNTVRNIFLDGAPSGWDTDFVSNDNIFSAKQSIASNYPVVIRPRTLHGGNETGGLLALRNDIGYFHSFTTFPFVSESIPDTINFSMNTRGSGESPRSPHPNREVDVNVHNRGGAPSWAAPALAALGVRLYREHGNWFDARSVLREMALKNIPKDGWTPEWGYGYVHSYDHPDSEFSRRPAIPPPQPPVADDLRYIGDGTLRVDYYPFMTSDYDRTKIVITGPNGFNETYEVDDAPLYVSIPEGGNYTAKLSTVHSDGQESEQRVRSIEVIDQLMEKPTVIRSEVTGTIPLFDGDNDFPLIVYNPGGREVSTTSSKSGSGLSSVSPSSITLGTDATGDYTFSVNDSQIDKSNFDSANNYTFGNRVGDINITYSDGTRFYGLTDYNGPFSGVEVKWFPSRPPDMMVGTANDVTYGVDSNKRNYVDTPGVLSGSSITNTNTGFELQAVLHDSPSNGNVVLNPNGSFIYVPNEGYTGSDSFDFAVYDFLENQLLDLATANLNVVGDSGPSVLALNNVQNKVDIYESVNEGLRGSVFSESAKISLDKVTSNTPSSTDIEGQLDRFNEESFSSNSLTVIFEIKGPQTHFVTGPILQSEGSFEYEITSLTLDPETEYEVTPIVDGKGYRRVRGNTVSFETVNTLENIPNFQPEPVTFASSDSAKLEASIDGSLDRSHRFRFEYGKNSFDNAVEVFDVPKNAGSVSKIVTGLEKDVEYQFRPVIFDGPLSENGSQNTFRTNLTIPERFGFEMLDPNITGSNVTFRSRVDNMVVTPVRLKFEYTSADLFPFSESDNPPATSKITTNSPGTYEISKSFNSGTYQYRAVFEVPSINAISDSSDTDSDSAYRSDVREFTI